MRSIRFGLGKQLKDAVKVSLGKNLSRCESVTRLRGSRCESVAVPFGTWRCESVSSSSSRCDSVMIFFSKHLYGWLPVGRLVGGGVCDSLFMISPDRWRTPNTLFAIHKLYVGQYAKYVI